MFLQGSSDYPLVCTITDHMCPGVASDPNRKIRVQATVGRRGTAEYVVQTLKNDEVVSQISLPKYLGLTDEVLLAVVKHRIELQQMGNAPCDEYQGAVDALAVAMKHLQARTTRLSQETQPTGE